MPSSPDPKRRIFFFILPTDWKDRLKDQKENTNPSQNSYLFPLGVSKESKRFF
ncbi:hypothetical protein LEP1GSC193_2391 [Leptospira alstonii serovar Pingchang str. 80-412]|uniref:Uncharacterized protein n=2 Tax=Leptospira alstonii TaxID=28452 RepID=M6DHU8_9LEPT|nr:hypothetical protein LEP1GSC194_2430 [Leptospira alstonii serovar Sichuan str. 79601]EQA80836.1 hypothetical protein LEP1GSC193_2391 [Leptospira alstonii serovar Pingchang str. 80-412]